MDFVRMSQSKHSEPAVMVQVRDIGYAIPGIVPFCNNYKHSDCIAELQRALRGGGRIINQKIERYPHNG